MPDDKREPQSYGSQADWVTGETGQRVHDPKAPPPEQERAFYDERRESETSDEAQGGLVSDFQLAENVQPEGAPTGADTPVQKVTTREGGAKRDSFFKKRDYE